MPRVESSSGRLAIPVDVVDRVEGWAAETGLSREDAAELAMRAAVPPAEPLAQQMLAWYQAGQLQHTAAVSQALAAAEVHVPMVTARLGSRRPLDEAGIAADPLGRSHVGVDLDAAPVDVWPAVRGVWRMSDRPRVVVALRLGRPMGIFRIGSWEQDPETGRRWAPTGQIVTGDGRLDAATGEPAGDLTDTDRAIFAAIAAAPLLLTQASANPISWLHGR